ncbi:SUKH-4 family immunity protein [Streptomyces sp. NPDC046716]|uniref:SUKH-4 family immunity protein n=1 Tax=Streptomyces sp. NPDC046716 TaxID=3157093 RepID=UPI0033EF4DB1
MEPATLPAGLTHAPSRRFLGEVGWPCSRVIGGLYTPDLRDTPLRPAADHPGMLEGLGRMASWTLYLDGERGTVFVDGGGELLPVARSMPRLLALALLSHLVLSMTSSELEMEALSEAAPSWFAALDPVAAESPLWEGVFDDLAYASEDYEVLLDELGTGG